MAEASGDLGVVFPRVEDGSRSTSALGRAVVADALRRVDPAGARAAERETNWRTGYLVHLRRLVEAGLASPAAALDIAQDGLGSVHARMRVAAAGGDDLPLDEALTGRPGRALGTARVRGTAAPERELSLPYRRERLRGDALLRQVDAWVRAGVAEPSAGAAIRAVVANPDWLDLSDRTVVVLGAGAEMGPLQALLRWGATVAGVDLPRPALWRRVLETARRGAGTLVVPVDEGAAPDQPQPGAAGADLLQEPGAVADWLTGLEGPLVLGDYVYADGAANVRVSVAVDGLRQELRRRRDDVALAFLATPTDVFAVPADAVAHSTRAYQSRSRIGRLAGRPLRTLSGGRLLRRAYVAGQAPGSRTASSPSRGRTTRWPSGCSAGGAGRPGRRAASCRSTSRRPPARAPWSRTGRSPPPTRVPTASGSRSFEPATSNTLMAALLVHDLRTGAGALEHPWRDEASGAVHGGLWRTAYDPRSALGLAALLGLTSRGPEPSGA
jgi:hypothetical protein